MSLSLALSWPLQVVELEGELGPGSSAGEGMCSHIRSEFCRSCLSLIAEELEQVDSFLTEENLC